MTREEVLKALDDFAAELADPYSAEFGTLLRFHLAPFLALRARKTPWSKIAELCASRGITGPDGETIKERTLTSQFVRACAKPEAQAVLAAMGQLPSETVGPAVSQPEHAQLQSADARTATPGPENRGPRPAFLDEIESVGGLMSTKSLIDNVKRHSS